MLFLMLFALDVSKLGAPRVSREEESSTAAPSADGFVVNNIVHSLFVCGSLPDVVYVPIFVDFYRSSSFHVLI